VSGVWWALGQAAGRRTLRQRASPGMASGPKLRERAERVVSGGCATGGAWGFESGRVLALARHERHEALGEGVVLAVRAEEAPARGGVRVCERVRDQQQGCGAWAHVALFVLPWLMKSCARKRGKGERTAPPGWAQAGAS